MKIIAPCKNCEDRTIKCHSTCEKYLAYRKQMDIDIALRREQSLMWNPIMKKNKRRK